MGYIKRGPASTYRTQRRGGRGVTGMTTREEDVVDTIFTASTHDQILFFTSLGRVYRLKGYQVPESGRTAKGMNVVNLLQLNADEKVTTMLHLHDVKPESAFVFFATKNGTVKRVTLESINTGRKSGLRAISLDEGDELVNVCLTSGEDHIILATKKGSAVRFHESEVRVMGREAAGVRGIRVGEDDALIGATLQQPDALLLTVTEQGYGKRTDPEEFTVHHRGGGGMTAHNLTAKTGDLVGLAMIREDEDLLLINSSGVVIRTPAETIRQCGRASQGVILIRLDEGDKVISSACAKREEEDEVPVAAPEQAAPAVDAE